MATPGGGDPVKSVAGSENDQSSNTDGNKGNWKPKPSPRHAEKRKGSQSYVANMGGIYESNDQGHGIKTKNNAPKNNEKQVHSGHETADDGYEKRKVGGAIGDVGCEAEGAGGKAGNVDGQTGKFVCVKADAGCDKGETGIMAGNVEGQTGKVDDETEGTCCGVRNADGDIGKAGYDRQHTNDRQRSYSNEHGNGGGNQGNNDDEDSTDDVKKQNSNGEENEKNRDTQGNDEEQHSETNDKDDSFHVPDEEEIKEAKEATAAAAAGSHVKGIQSDTTNGEDESEPDGKKFDNDFDKDDITEAETKGTKETNPVSYVTTSIHDSAENADNTAKLSPEDVGPTSTPSTTPSSGNDATTTTPSNGTVATTTTPSPGTVGTTTASTSGTVATTTSPSPGTVGTTTASTSGTVATPTASTSGTVATTTTPSPGTVGTTTASTSGTVATTTTPSPGTVGTTTASSSGTVATTTTPSPGTVGTTTASTSGTVATTTTPSPGTVGTTTASSSGTVATTTTPSPGTVGTTTASTSGTVATTTTPSPGTVGTTTASTSGTVATTTTPSPGTVGTTTSSTSGTVATTTTPSSGTVATTTTPSPGTVGTTTASTSGTVATTTTPSPGTVGTTTASTSGTVATTTTPSPGTVGTTTSSTSGTVATTTTPSSGNVATTATPLSGNVATTTTPSPGTVGTTTSSTSGTVATTTTPSSGNVATTTTPLPVNVGTRTTPSPGTVGTTTTPSSGNVATTTTPSSGTDATPTTPSSGTVATPTTPLSGNVATTTTTTTPLGNVSMSSSQSHESAKHSPIDIPSEPNTGQSESSEVNESQDSDDIELLENDDDKGEVPNTSENFASISPPVSKMVESSSLPPEEKEDNSVNKISKTETKEVNQKKETENVKTDYANPNKNTGHVAAEKSSEDTSVPKTKGKFTLKPPKQGNKYLIKSDACSKPFIYKSKSVGVYIDDEDDLLYDGEDIYQIVVDKGIIKLDGLSAAETLNSTAPTINPQGSQSSSNKADGTEQTDDAKKNTNSSTLANPGCESGKLSKKITFCLSGAESKNTPIISMKTFDPKQPSKVTLYSFGCKDMGIYLRWTITLRNKSLLKQITQEYKIVAVSSPDDVLVIEDPDRKYCTEEMAFDFASSVIDCMKGITKNYKTEGISLDGNAASMFLSAVRQLQVYQDQQIVEYYDEHGDVLWVLFHSSQRKQLIDVIDKARVKHNPADKQFVKTLSLHFFMHKILSGKQFMDDFEKSCKNVDITHQVVDNDDSVIVTLRSACKEDAESAKKWICSKEQNYASASFSYKHLNVPPHFEASVIVDEFLRRAFERKDVSYVRNETTQNVWIWSESLSQNELDEKSNNVKRCVDKNEVIKPLSLLKSKWSTTVMKKLSFHENSTFVKISYEGENVTITGLCQIVDQIGCELKKGSHSGLDQTSSASSTSPVPPPRKPRSPNSQRMDRGDDGTPNPKFDKKDLCEFDSHQGLVWKKDIPKNMKSGSLFNDIKSKINDPALKIVFIEGSGEALLIFKDKTKVDAFLKKAQGYQKVGGRGLGNFSGNVNVPTWIALGSNAERKLKKELENVGVTMNANGGKTVISAPTSYQMKHAMKILKDFVSNVNNQCTIIKDVPELVWRTVCIIRSQTISGIESKCGRKIDFSEEKSQVCWPATEKCMDEKIKELRKEIDDMKQKEISEMKLTSKEAENVENVCKELESAEGMNYWLLDRGMKTVYIYGDSYENLSKHKTQLEIKIGRKKLTARGKRANAQIVETSTEVTQKPNNQASAVSSLGLKTYVTAEGITVSVYKADILNLNVDCIVNAANGELSHGGGVARVISKRAGSALDTECKEYIRKHGKLNVGQCCSTTAGNLKYRCVIHTVGPAWHDYGRQKHAYNKTDRPCRNKKDCEDDLMLAVWNSFCEAEKQGMKTIALPAISSAIFGVPMDICVTQYVRGVQKYSKKKGHYGSPLLEIHFIDINEDTVRAIQKAFSESLSSASFVHDKTRLDHSSDDEPEKRNKKNDEKPPEPLMFESGSREFQFYFMGNTDNNKLLLCKKDIETLRDISAIVVPVNQRGEGAVINRLISEKVEYKDQFLQDKKRLFEMQRREAGDVVEIPGYGCGFMCILYVVYHRPKTQDTFRVKNLQDVLTNMLRHADSNQRIRSVAIPMFGIVKPGDTEEKPHLSNVKNAMQSMKLQVYNVMSKTEFYDSDKGDEVQMFSLVLLKTYKQFCDEKLKKGSKSPLEVVVMCHTDAMFQIAKKTCADHVNELKASYQEEKPDGAVGNDQELSSTNEEDPSSLGNCVICMDAMTNPKTIRCGHTFCTDCIDQSFQYKKQCPTCGTVCGIITGDQPEGTMKDEVRGNFHLPGFERCGSIVITYTFQGGRQEDHHPSPGTWYKGITRSAYLPNNDEGRKILKMLKIAFDRKVTFTIGNSRTTGQQGVITWNDIHHKTDHRPNTQFGYPDPTYLVRVKDELAAKGITEDDIQ